MLILLQLSYSYLIFSSLLGICIIFFLHYYLSNNKSRSTPCPDSYPIIGNIISFVENRHRFHDWVAEMLAATPSLTLQVNGFLGLSHGICTANPSNIEQMLRSNFKNYVKGDRFQSVLDELLGHGIFNVDGHLWSTQRKIASHEFNTKSLKSFISTTVQTQLCNKLIPYLCSVSERGHVIDFQEILRRFTFDNICSVAFGVENDVSFDDDCNDLSSFVGAFDFAVEVSSDRFMSPLPLIWKIKRRLNIGNEKRYKEAIKVINEYAFNIIATKEKCFHQQEKAEETKQDQDLLSRFIESTSSNLFEFQDQQERRKFLRDIVISFILAGKDSTSTALTWFFWLISGHPRCEGLIYNELMAATKSENGNYLYNNQFSYNQLKNLHYLHAAITEALRLFPPVPINSRLVVSDDTLRDGTFVGKGWFADYSAYSMARMQKLWGDDCCEFKPERWLDEDGVFQACDQFKFPVFHSGPRMCLGKEMAYVQMKCVAAAVLYEFHVGVDGCGGDSRRVLLDHKQPPYTLSLLLKMKDGLPVRLLKRREIAN
ncbi:oxygenase [Lithospermum erythrorhizon]|uniref:Oxygenase n=1 Tax=Lithospermum erythrorhizon TaxID=34254 RepID=A0AAV3NJB2_LITER